MCDELCASRYANCGMVATGFDESTSVQSIACFDQAIAYPSTRMRDGGREGGVSDGLHRLPLSSLELSSRGVIASTASGPQTMSDMSEPGFCLVSIRVPVDVARYAARAMRSAVSLNEGNCA
jgi:hypothetical protein